MKITFNSNKRLLIQDNGEIINVSDGEIISYIGIYYKKVDEIVTFAEIQTQFIGMVDTNRSDETGITGIYIIPMYIWDNLKNEWFKIINYESPKSKYFSYPHLLMLPDYTFNYKPLYFLHTCKNKNVDEFKQITKGFNL